MGNKDNDPMSKIQIHETKWYWVVLYHLHARFKINDTGSLFFVFLLNARKRQLLHPDQTPRWKGHQKGLYFLAFFSQFQTINASWIMLFLKIIVKNCYSKQLHPKDWDLGISQHSHFTWWILTQTASQSDWFSQICGCWVRKQLHVDTCWCWTFYQTQNGASVIQTNLEY